jgi:hypothetical protein
MSSLGEFLNAMVELRKNKAQVAEYNASQQYKGMEALGSGIGDLLGGLGKGLGTREDVLANRLRNEAMPPRAMAVNKSLQAAADTTVRPGQIPYDQIPLTAGGPFTGGVKGLNMQEILDKAAIREERATQAGNLAEARIGHMGAIEEIRRTEQDRKDLEVKLKQEREARLQETAMYKHAQDALKNATPDYQKRLKETTTYTQRMQANLASAASAKDQASYDKAVSLITSEYMAMDKLGYKIAYPEIPVATFQRAAGQALTEQIARKQGKYDALYPWQSGAAIKTDIEEKQAKLKALGDYNYQSPGLQEWNIPEQPTRPVLEDYLPGGSAYQEPAQAQLQGPTPSAAAPQGGGTGGGGGQTISLDEARKINPTATKDRYLQVPGPTPGTFKYLLIQ